MEPPCIASLCARPAPDLGRGLRGGETCGPCVEAEIVEGVKSPTNEAAGRGVTTGQTAQDDEVQVLDPDEDKLLRGREGVQVQKSMMLQKSLPASPCQAPVKAEKREPKLSQRLRISWNVETGSRPSMMQTSFREKSGKNSSHAGHA